MNISISHGSVVYLLVVFLLIVSACRADQSDPGIDGRDQENKSTQKGSAVASTLAARDLLSASLTGRINVVRQALGQGVDVNVTGKEGNTPLMLASYNGHTEAARLLLKRGARISGQNADGRTPLIFAASGPFPETVDLLLQWDADPNVVDEAEGWSPLMFAAAGGHRDVVRVLLRHGADASLQDKEGDTALSFAKDGNYGKVIDLLNRP